MMDSKWFDIGRRTGAAALAILIAVGSLSGTSVPRVCHMKRASAIEGCDSCVPHHAPATGTSLSAASCCRFDAPRDTPTTPVLTVAAQRLAMGGDVLIVLPGNSSASRETATASIVRLVASIPIHNSLTTSVLRL